MMYNNLQLLILIVIIDKIIHNVSFESHLM